MIMRGSYAAMLGDQVVDNIFLTLNLALFIPAALALLLTPGPVVLYVVTRSIDQGRKAGLVSVLGSGLGNLFHVAAAALGLSAILLSSSLVFDIVKYLGAGYLIYLGIRKLLSRDETTTEAVKRDSLSRIFFQGMTVAIFNPKTALFFFAFLPQFVDPTKGNIALQISVLGTILVSMGITTDTIYALTAGSLGRWLRGNLKFLRVQRYVTGSVYIGLGITAAFTSSNKKV
jgi:threonine/homoserine/homoserine lactone efflux protein